jgi:hypothetical protein
MYEHDGRLRDSAVAVAAARGSGRRFLRRSWSDTNEARKIEG